MRGVLGGWQAAPATNIWLKVDLSESLAGNRQGQAPPFGVDLE